MKRGNGIILLVVALTVLLVASLYVNELFGVKDISGKITADDPDLCYFLDSNGDCTTTALDVAAAMNLVSLKPISCTISTTGGYNECKRTLDANGDGVITSLDIAILRDKASLKSIALPGAPANIIVVSPIQIDGLNPYELKLKVLTKTGLPSVLTGVNVGAERKFTDLNGIVSFTMPASTTNINALIKKHPNKGVSEDITYTGCMPLCSSSVCGGDDGCGGTCEDKRSLSFFFEDPAASTTVTDSSGNVIGTKYGGVTQVPGNIGNALNFDGVNDYVGVNFLQVGQSITVLSWAKSNTAVWNNAGLIASARGNNGFLVTPLAGQKNVGGYIMSSNSASNWIGSYVPDDITQWHQYGIRYNYQTKEASIIFNGQIVVSKIIDISRTTGTITVNFGKDTTIVAYGKGAIDEIEIYRAALSDQEILARYQSSSHLCA